MADKSRFYKPTPEAAAAEAYKHGDNKTVETISKEGYDLGKQPWFYKRSTKLGMKKKRKRSTKR